MFSGSGAGAGRRIAQCARCVATATARSGVCARAAVGPTGRNRAALSPTLRPATMFTIIALDTVPCSISKKVPRFYVICLTLTKKNQNQKLLSISSPHVLTEPAPVDEAESTIVIELSNCRLRFSRLRFSEY